MGDYLEEFCGVIKGDTRSFDYVIMAFGISQVGLWHNYPYPWPLLFLSGWPRPETPNPKTPKPQPQKTAD